MGTYKVNHPYSAVTTDSVGVHQFGPWSGGEELDLDDAQADWINRDCENTLTRLDHVEEEPDDDGEVDLDDLGVRALRKIAAEREVDLDGASKKEEILTRLREAESRVVVEEEPDDDIPPSAGV